MSMRCCISLHRTWSEFFRWISCLLGPDSILAKSFFELTHEICAQLYTGDRTNSNCRHIWLGSEWIWVLEPKSLPYRWPTTLWTEPQVFNIPKWNQRLNGIQLVMLNCGCECFTWPCQSLCGDKTVSISSCLHNMNPYTDKVSLHCIRRPITVEYFYNTFQYNTMSHAEWQWLKYIWMDAHFKDHFMYAPSQWETTLQCNAVSHCLGAYKKCYTTLSITTFSPRRRELSSDPHKVF